MEDELVVTRIELPGGELRIHQPAEAAELPDDREVEWAPLAPYWAVVWRSGVALARELEGVALRGQRVVELGCGLGVPSLAAARAGAQVLAADVEPEALELLGRNAAENGVHVETALADWAEPSQLIDRGPFDLVVAADVLYERSAVAPLLGLLPRLAGEALVADPGRPSAEPFLEGAATDWTIETAARGVVRIHRLRRLPPTPRGE
jgi:predicted nicotinamide N-methyase